MVIYEKSANRRLTFMCASFAMLGFLSSQGASGGDDDDRDYDESRSHQRLNLHLPNTTQGPFWPPSAITDDNGNFIVIGNLLVENDSGMIEVVPSQVAIVSKDTVPPLDESGREDFTNRFGAPYKVIRHLNLNPGSPDLDLVLHTNSYGPAEGDFGGGPRIPREGDSLYNLNNFHTNGDNCPEIFPAESQRYTYKRPSFALHETPIWGFQGDDIAYDVNTGELLEPRFKNGEECHPEGCWGEDSFHTRRNDPVTLGEWLAADVKLKIRLTEYDSERKGYTGAKFKVVARDLLPNSIYTVVFVRASFLRPSPIMKLPHPPVIPAHIITDEDGNGTLSFSLENPFPDPATDDAGMRVIGIGLGYKSDFSVFGACSLRFGAGVDIHAVVASTADGTLDFTPFVTVPPSE